MKNSIKIARSKKGYTQQDLANLLDVSRQTINSIEANRYVPSTVLALKLALHLEEKVEDLFELDLED